MPGLSECSGAPSPATSSGDGGARLGLIVIAASFVGHFSNYLFYVVTARMLGPTAFAEVSALVAFATLVFQPFNGVQLVAARDVARLGAAGRGDVVSGYVRQLFVRTTLVNALVLAVIVAASELLRSWLNLESTAVILLAAVWIVLGTTLLVCVGVVQGMQRFGEMTWQLAGPLGALRVVLLPGLVLAAGISGSMLAMIGATVIGLLTAMRVMGRLLSKRSVEAAPPVRWGMPVAVLIGFSSLVNSDIIFAKASLPGVAAGVYSSAALLGKVALFAPAALVLVLLPKVAAKLQRGENADRMILSTLLMTLAASSLIVIGLALVPSSLIALTFGPAFVEARGLLVPLALVMTVAALLNVHLACAMAAHDNRFVVVVVGAVILHLTLLSVLHDSAGSIIMASAIAIGSAFVTQEALSATGFARLVVRRLLLRER